MAQEYWPEWAHNPTPEQLAGGGFTDYRDFSAMGPDGIRQGVVQVDRAEVVPLLLTACKLPHTGLGVELARWVMKGILFDVARFHGLQTVNIFEPRSEATMALRIADQPMDDIPAEIPAAQHLAWIETTARERFPRHYGRHPAPVPIAKMVEVYDTEMRAAAEAGRDPLDVKLPKHPVLRGACEAIRRAAAA